MYCLGTHKRKTVFLFLFQISREEYLKGLVGKDGRSFAWGLRILTSISEMVTINGF